MLDRDTPPTSLKIFQPAPAQKNTPESIATAAKRIVKRLREQAEKRKGLLDDVDQPFGYGQSDADDERYQLNHTACLSLEESGLSQKCFYAVSTLIENTIKLRIAKSQQLEVQVLSGTKWLKLCASHPHHIKMNSDMRNKTLEAPISLINFDQISHDIDEILEFLLSDKNVFLQSDEKSVLCMQAVREICKELDKKFELHVKWNHHNDLFEIANESWREARAMICGVDAPSIQPSHPKI